MIKIYDIVISKVEISSIPKDTVGTVVHIYDKGETFEVEFVKEDGSVDVETVSSNQIETKEQNHLSKKRLQALHILNDHFKNEGHLGCLEDRQIKLVLDAMIEFHDKEYNELRQQKIWKNRK